MKKTPIGEPAAFYINADLDNIRQEMESFVLTYCKFMHKLYEIESFKKNFISSFVNINFINFHNTLYILSPDLLSGYSKYMSIVN